MLVILLKGVDDKKYNIGKELKVSILPEHIWCMFYNVEVIIALPSGLETLDGISSITYWAKLNFYQKSLRLLNVNDFYDSLLSFF